MTKEPYKELEPYSIRFASFCTLSGCILRHMFLVPVGPFSPVRFGRSTISAQNGISWNAF